MTSDSGCNSQETDYARLIQEVLDELRQMQQLPQLVTTPAALEAFEREIRQRTDRLGSLLVGYHLQQALVQTPSKPRKSSWCTSGPSRSKTMARSQS